MQSTTIRILVLLLFVAAPFIQTNTYWQHVFGVALIGAILALGLQLLVGMAGLLSLGQGAFYGIGAYVSAVLTLHFGVPFSLAFLAAGVVAAISSLLLVPIVKLPSSSLAVATLGVQYHHLPFYAQRGVGDGRQLWNAKRSAAKHLQL